ncbi:MAG TPA: hypothetical protein VN578_25580 [Candidatus Binatia bacterium]|jgi:hypothetical protein|nr:hypothetical protein [Candidatus Binatia bacterium]
MKTAFFPARTLGQLPADNLEALAALGVEFERLDGHARQMSEQHDDYVEALSILRAFAMARDEKLPPFPEIGPQRHQNITNITAYFSQLRQTVRAALTSRHAKGYFESKTEEYVSLFSKVPVYEFSEPEFQRVQRLIDELRELFRNSHLIPEEQKRRLLRRLEAMRAELHRRTNDIDRFWGFIGEAGIALRKFGQDLQPISERVMELGRLVTTVIFEKEGIKALPELSQMLVAEGKSDT